jgi:hypothetical protein
MTSLLSHTPGKVRSARRSLWIPGMYISVIAFSFNSILLHGQPTLSEWNPPGTDVRWLLNDNWDTEAFPNAPDMVAWFGSNSTTDSNQTRDGASWPTSTLTIQMANIGGAIDVAAIVVGSDNTVDRRIRNNAGNTWGDIRIHGVDLTIDGQPYENLLLGNFSQDNQVRIYTSSANQPNNVMFMTSGNIHVHNPDAQIRITSRILEAEAAGVSLTKTGPGILILGNDSGSSFFGTDIIRNEITGNFIIQEGIVEVTGSGAIFEDGTFNSTYGQSSLVLEGGSLRSSSSGNRNIHNDVVLDGTFTFGSPDPDFNGSFGVTTQLEGRSTVLASDSTLHLHNVVNWHQDISGDHSLTKEGPGTLNLSGLVDVPELRVGAGAVYLQASDQANTRTIDGAVVVESGATLGADGTITGLVTVESGGMLAAGDAMREGHMHAGGLTLSDGSVVDFALMASDFAGITVNGPISLQGATLSVGLGFQPGLGDVFLLIENLGGLAILGELLHDGTPLSEGDMFLIANEEFTQLFEITYGAGDSNNSIALVAVPESSTWALMAGILGLGAMAIRRRRPIPTL